MRRKNAKWIVLIILLAFAAPFILQIFEKITGNDPSVDGGGTAQKPLPELNIPKFSADSAYAHTDKIVSFGPRIVGSAGAAKVKAWVVGKFKEYGADIIEQNFKANTFDGKSLDATNIIARYNLQATKRIVLSAHWDSRPFADHDPDSTKHKQPILGADDSGSSVGTLIEIARQLQANPLSNIGVDIVLFDAEDYGAPEKNKGNTNDTWALGSQYWSKNPHVTGYSPAYGINLDMIGARGARYEKEGTSMKYASQIVEKVWRVGRHIGFYNYFLDEKYEGELTDDHYFVNTIARFPMIDIINININPSRTFGDYWHTTSDNMSIIDKDALNAAGQTVLSVLHYEQAGAL
ncbi:MAG TPA: M28 family peptidase [Allocoleopsis sp.]